MYFCNPKHPPHFLGQFQPPRGMLRILRATAYVHYTTSLTLSLPFVWNTPIIPHLPLALEQYRNHTASSRSTSGGGISRVISGGSSRVSEHSGAVAMVSSGDEEVSDNEIRSSPTSHYVSYMEEVKNERDRE